MSLSGDLADVTVAEVIEFIHLGGRTGTLTLTNGEVSASVGFHRGRIVNASGPRSPLLGELLLKAGVIDHRALQLALMAQEQEQPRRSLGQILVARKALTLEVMYGAVERQIASTVYELVGWTQGTFNFALDVLHPIDDLAVVPGDVIQCLSLDTQMVLLDALRIFDERSRDTAQRAAAAQGSAAAQRDGASQGVPPKREPPALQPAPVPAVRAERPPQPTATPPHGVPPVALGGRVRLQVVSPDAQLAKKMAQALNEAVVVQVNLRDAGTPPPGEPPPLVLLDLRQNAVSIDAIPGLRRARPRASILAVVDRGAPLLPVYQAGAMAAVPGEPGLIIAAFRSIAQNRLDLITGGARADHADASFNKLRRIVGDLRSGLISTTISLSLMNIISESVERAVFFLVKRDCMVALGAFGSCPDGQSLAHRSRGLKFPLTGKNALTEALAGKQVHAVPFEQGGFPDPFRALVGRPRSGQCAVFPVHGAQRVIALVYVDNGHTNHAIEELDILELAAVQAGLALENEVLRRQGDHALR